MSLWKLCFFTPLIAILAYLLAWPTGTHPAVWTAQIPPTEQTGPFKKNDGLKPVEMLGEGVGKGGEDVAVDVDGRIYTGYKDGRIVRFDSKGENPEELIQTQGRPLGLDFDNQGNLIIADADRGLLRLSPDGVLDVLSTGTEEHKLIFTDDVDVAPDGRIYFSDASAKYNRHELMKDLIEHRPNGLLLRYDPKTQTTEVLLKDLYFANGIAVSSDGSFVLVVETTAYRVRKYWLSGPQTGSTEVIIDNLPGMPDGISTGTQGRFWMPLVAPRSPLLDVLSPYPSIREILLRLPKAIQPKALPYGYVLAIDKTGQVVMNLQNHSPDSLTSISSVEEWGSHIYLGTISNQSMGRLTVSKKSP